jgi:integrase
MGRGPGVRAVGEESIQIDFKYQNQRCREWVRLAPTKANLAYCRGWKRRIEDEIAHGTFDYLKHFPDSKKARRLAKGQRLSDYIEHTYLPALKPTVQPETLTEYTNDAATVCKALDDPRLHLLTTAMFRTWVSKQELSKSRIDSLLRPIRGALEMAVVDQLIPKSPLTGFTVKRAETKGKETDEIDPFTPKEVAKLAADENGDLWQFWAYTGPRSGEIIGLQHGDVADDFSTVTIKRAVRRGRIKPPKTKAGVRTIQLPPPAKEALKRVAATWGPRWKADSTAPVFRNPNTGGWWHEAKALNRAFTRACVRRKVRRRYVYQLRHTFATWCLSAGENPKWIQVTMGHASLEELFETYGKWMDDMNKAAGSKMLEAAMLAMAD